MDCAGCRAVRSVDSNGDIYYRVLLHLDLPRDCFSGCKEDFHTYMLCIESVAISVTLVSRGLKHFEQPMLSGRLSETEEQMQGGRLPQGEFQPADAGH